VKTRGEDGGGFTKKLPREEENRNADRENRKGKERFVDTREQSRKQKTKHE